LKVAPGHFVYGDMTGVEVGMSEGINVGVVRIPAGKLKDDPFGSRPREVFDHDARFVIPIGATQEADDGVYRVAVATRHQGCNDSMCFFPSNTNITAYVVVGSGDREFSLAAGGLTGGGVFDFGATLASGGLLAVLALLFVGGFLTSLTPCVYPIIVGTVSFFGAMKTTRTLGLMLSIAFVLGMAAMYSGLGVAAAATGAVFGQVMSSGWVIGFVALLFSLFALSMFGVYDIELPSSAQTRLAAVGGAGPVGAFLAGLVAGVIAAPCTGPVLAAVLAYIATTGDLFLGFISLFVFALGMGVLFIAVGTFAVSLPKGGRWMVAVKGSFGVVMLALALFFLKDVIPPLKDVLRNEDWFVLLAAGLIASGLALGAIGLDFHQRKARRVVARKLVGVIIAVAGLYMGAGAFTVGGYDGPDWITREAAGLSLGREQGRPVMIDFFAEWCQACKELDAYTYSDSQVLESLERFVSVKLDFTENSPKNDSLKARYSIVGLPTVVFIDSDGHEVAGSRLVGFLDADEFVNVLGRIR